ncbi:glycosyltransferase [Enterovibrio norvegicus]|uniref:glycosyltransferase n=1 Tax=Enterovibrio norvegicus TaxID=188144 RepID=UPI00354C26C8
MQKTGSFLSVVIVTKNQSDFLIDYLRQLSSYLSASFHDYEIVIVDLDSTDGTDIKISKELKCLLSIRFIKLSESVDSEVALAAGLENAIGDLVINLDIERDDHTIVSNFVEKCLAGNDIVVGTSKNATTAVYRLIRRLSTGLIKSIGYSLPRNSTGVMCLSRRALNSATETGKYQCKLYVRIANTGYKISTLSYQLKPSFKKKTVFSGVSETMHHMIFNSTKPLRWMSFLGASGSLLAFFFAFYSLVMNFMRNNVVEGWTTTIIFLSVLFHILFIMLAFFGEYMSRILNELNQNSEYTVVYEKSSSVMLDVKRVNVMSKSIGDDDNLVKTGRNR